MDPVAEGLGPVDVPEGHGEDDFGRSVASEDSRGQGEAVVDHAQAVQVRTVQLDKVTALLCDPLN